MQLSDRDRSFILKQLAAAPDSVLADAMLEYNLIRDKLVAVRKLSAAQPFTEASYGEPEPVIVAPTVTTHAPNIVEGDDRPNVNPGVSAIGKIGSKTKDDLLAMLRGGEQPSAKFAEHLKLLWSRDEVKFDGKEWWL